MPVRRIWVVRHGESEANAGLRTAEPGAVVLTSAGHRQAAAFAALVDEKPTLIVTSPFIRTAQTAAPLRARFWDVAHEEWPVEEFTYLAPDRCAHTTYDERRPHIEAYWTKCDPHLTDGARTESFAAMLTRARSALDRFSGVPPGLTVMFSHAQFMRAMRLIARYPEAAPPELMAAFVEDARRDPIANCQSIIFERS